MRATGSARGCANEVSLSELDRLSQRMLFAIAQDFDKSVPQGFRWHRELLDQMKVPTEQRPAVINQQEYDLLLPYLASRHLVSLSTLFDDSRPRSCRAKSDLVP